MQERPNECNQTADVWNSGSILSRTLSTSKKVKKTLTISNEIPGDVKEDNKVLKANTRRAFVVSWITLPLLLLENELFYSNGNSETVVTILLRAIVGILSLYQVYLGWVYYSACLKTRKRLNLITESTRLHQDFPTLWWFVGETLVNGMFLVPGINYDFTFYQISTYSKLSLDDIFLILALLRCVHTLKLIYHHSRYNKLKHKYSFLMQHRELDLNFSLKAWIKDRPVVYVAGMPLCLLVIGGLLLRVFERYIPESDFYDVWTGFWVGGVTQTTVGYGDIVPVSHAGRLICILSCFFGVHLYSSMVLIVENSTDLSSTEWKLYSAVVTNRNAGKKRRKIAVKLVQRWWRLKAQRRSQGHSLNGLCWFTRCLNQHKRIRACLRRHEIVSVPYLLEGVNSVIDKAIDKAGEQLARAHHFEQQSLIALRNQYNVKQKVEAVKRGTISLMRTAGVKFLGSHSAVQSPQKSKVQLKLQRDCARKKLIRSNFGIL